MTAPADAIDAEGDPIAAVEAWRVRHPAGVDAVGLAVAQALARRAAAQQGPARQVMARRLAQWLDGLAEAGVVQAKAPGPAAALAGLSDLVDRLGRTPAVAPTTLPPAASGAVRAPATGPASSAPSSGPSSGPSAGPNAGLRSVAAYKSTWSRLRAEQRLRQAAAQVPGNAGPLHSAQVIHRALREMHGLSPGYLDAFMSHVESLMALEQAAGPAPLPATTSAAAAPAAARVRQRRRGAGKPGPSAAP